MKQNKLRKDKVQVAEILDIVDNDLEQKVTDLKRQIIYHKNRYSETLNDLHCLNTVYAMMMHTIVTTESELKEEEQKIVSLQNKLKDFGVDDAQLRNSN